LREAQASGSLLAARPAARIGPPVSAVSPQPNQPPFRTVRRADERIALLGAEMDLVRPEEVMHFIRGRVAARAQSVVANHNLHSLYLIRRSAEMRALYARADLIEVDSAPLLAWARLVHGRGRPFHRCTYLDWREAFWSLAEALGWRVYYVGGKPGVVEAATTALTARWPGLTLGGRDGYFGARDEDAVVQAITAFAPQVLLVGMGMPLQEAFILRNLEALPTCVILPVGAAFDYEAGVQTPAPRWMGRIGLEWLFRLARDPRRLFVRYCVEPWSLVGPALQDLRRRKRG
jgi:N-acetylglucosaminyldiphosphoundecaprenol N-acetyl-beta-D-mannosaminyltransferase